MILPTFGLFENREFLDVMLSPAQRRVLRAFLRAVALAEPLQRELATKHHVSIGDLHAVRVLSRIGETPVSVLGGELGLARSTVTNLVDRLERAGLVARVPSPTDRRVTLVRLTQSGSRAVEAVAQVGASDVARRILALDAVDQASLAELLERVLATVPETAGATEVDPSVTEVVDALADTGNAR